MLKCVQSSLREDFNSIVMEWFVVCQKGMSKKIWKEAMVAAVEARVEFVRPDYSIKKTALPSDTGTSQQTPEGDHGKTGWC